MNNIEFPKVLFVTPCAFNHITSGVTFSNLFRGWPKEKLAVVTDDPIPVSYDVCNQYFFLSDSEHRYIKPFCWLYHRKRSQKSQFRASQSLKPSGLFRLAKQIIGEAGIPDSGLLSPSLNQWIKNFQPDLLYTILGSVGYIELVEQIQQAFGLPLVIHLMDEGVTDPQKRGIFGNYLRRTYKHKFEALLPKTSLRIAICEAMAKEYNKRYNLPFIHFQNTVDVEEWSKFAKKDFEIKDEARIVYTGSIHPSAQLQSIIDCCEAVAELQNKAEKIRLDIYTPLSIFGQYSKNFHYPGSVYLHDAVRDDNTYFKILGDADLLLLPVNFDQCSVHFVRYSFPTKLSAYLCSGTPILVYGPAGVAQAEYAREYGWGYVVNQKDREILMQTIVKLIKNIDLRKQLSSKARECARKNHDSAKIRRAFQERLAEVGNQRER